MENNKTSLIVPEKVLTKVEISNLADIAIANMLEIGTATEAYVKMAVLEKLIEEIKDKIKERAILGVQSKEMNVLGATVTTRRKTEYKYDCPTCDSLEMKVKVIKEDIKAIKKSAEKFGSFVDPLTGEINTAELVADGLIIAVSLPKE
jgi:hypothetical protein